MTEPSELRGKVEEIIRESCLGSITLYTERQVNKIVRKALPKLLALIEPLQAGRKKGMENMADKELKEKMMDEMLTDTADLIVMQYLAPHAFDEIFDRLIRKGWRKL